MHGLEADYYDKINFVYLDVDDPANETFKKELRFTYQPQMALLDGNGQVLHEWVGPLPREEFEKVFQAVLSQ